MGVFAESYILKVDLPYSEYWLPLAIGMGVGVCALAVSRLVFGHKKNFTPRVKQTLKHDPFTEGSTTEQRKSFRRDGNPTEVYVALPEQKNKPERGWVLDRSMGGIGIQSRTLHQAGTRLAVLPVNAPEMTPWVDIEVRTCRENGEGHELGCQFIKTPNWSVLLMFG